jgi:hypothetical protein
MEYINQVDLKCDYCTSKLSDFIDRQNQQPQTWFEANRMARLFGWQVKGTQASCPACVQNFGKN